MTPERYKRISETFLETCDLHGDARKTRLAELCGDDHDLAREVENLLNYHQPATVVSSRRPTRSRAVLWVLTVAVAAAALLAGIRIWTVGSMDAAVRHSQAVLLKGFLDVRVNMLRSWAERQCAEAKAVVDDPEFVRHVEELHRIASTSSDRAAALLQSPSYAPVAERLERVPDDLGGRGYNIYSPEGFMMVSEDPAMLSAELSPSGGTYLRRGMLGEWGVSRPFRDRFFLIGVAPKVPTPILFVGGPIRNADGVIVGLVTLRFDAEKAFEGFFTDPPGELSPEIFAFDEKGVLLTDLRDRESLKALGVISGTTVEFEACLRDPGGVAAAQDTWPMTRMARSACAGGSGVDTQGYRDIRGNEVIGAWTWLPEWSMGIAVELDMAKALMPLSPVRNAFGLLFGLLAAAALAAFWIASRWELRRKENAATAFGPYILERRIGMGGMADVFLARHAMLKRPTAIKVLDAPGSDPGAVVRFEREARLAASLTHPNTIQIFDYGRAHDGRFYCAMEYIEGMSLGQLLTLAGAPLPPARAIHLLRQICGSLEEAHAAGLVHRDIKPANIMVCRRAGVCDVVKVLDFGIARSFVDTAGEQTTPDQIPGTPLFIAPERVRSPKEADPRSDLYSLGAVAFHMVAGRNVFEGGGAAEILYQVMTAQRPSPSRLRGEPIPEALEKLILACLSIDPAARPPDARSMREALEAIATPDRWGPDEAQAWWSANEERIARFIAASEPPPVW